MSLEIPGYKIVRTLGRGGMATVYLAIQEVFEREVALKVMSRVLAEDSNFAKRFFREAKIVSKLVHPNIVTVHDVGMHDGHCYLSMEYIDGKDLKHVSSTLNLKQKIQVVVDIAKALSYSGSKGYVHRDIKPENIMFHTSDGRAVLMDFGIARAAESDTMVTQVGTAIGTPHYMSPEQAKGKPVDHRSDIYSLGVVFFYMINGRVPYDADSAVGIGIKHITEPVPLLPKAFESLQPVLDQMMAKEVSQRYQDAKALMADLAVIDPTVLEGTSGILQYEVSSSPTLGNMPTVESQEEVVESFEGSHYDHPTDLNRFDDFNVDSETLVKDRTPIVSWFFAVAFMLSVLAAFVYFKFPDLVHSWIAFAQVKTEQVLAPQKQEPPVDPVEKTSKNVSPRVSQTELVQNQASPTPSSHTPQIKPQPASPTTHDSTDSQNAAGSLDPNKQDQLSSPIADVDVSAQLVEINKKLASLHAAYENDSIYLGELVTTYRKGLQLAPDNQQLQTAFSELKQAEYEQLHVYANKVGTSNQLDNRVMQLKTLFPEVDQSTYVPVMAAAKNRKKVLTYLLEAKGYLKQNNLTKPKGRNALDRYQKALALDGKNREAKAGIESIANTLAKVAQQRFDAGQLADSLALVNRALSLDPNNKSALALKQKIQAQNNRKKTIASLLANAERKIRNEQLFLPENKAAFHDYQRVLDLEPGNPQAKAGLETLVDALSKKVWRLVSDEQFIQAKEVVGASLNEYGENARVKSLSMAVDELIGENVIDVKPRIESLKIDSSPIENLDRAYPNVFFADRSIFLGFYYKNFQSNTTVIQAVLTDGSKSTQIAQVPVVVEGKQGQATFRIDRPVDGFPVGSYSVEMRVGRDTLNTTLFKVK